MLGHAIPSLLQHVRRLAATASSDEQLLADFLARRDEQAFAALLSRHGPMVLNVGRRILHDAHAAEDVFQATFLVLADRAASIRRPAALAGFLHGVAYRLAVRARQHTSPKRQRGTILPLAGASGLCAGVCDRAAGPPEEVAWKEMLGILDRELGRLPDRSRAPLVLCYLEGRTQDEAARQLGWGLNTLRRRLAQGRRLLEARLRGRGVTLPAALAGLLAANAVAVPGRLRAATLAAAGTRAAGAAAAGAPALSPARKGISVWLTSPGKKIGALVAVATLAAAVGFGYVLTAPAHQPPAAGEPPPAAPAADAGRADPAADPLPARGVVRLGTARYRHGSRIESFAVSADGRLAVAASGDCFYSPAYGKTVRCAQVFDMTDGRHLYSFPPDRGREIEAVGLSPDGKTLAAKDDTFLYFLDAATGNELRKLRCVPDSGRGYSPTDWIAFTPDGKRVAVSLTGDAVVLIDAATCKVVRTFPSSAGVTACVFSPDGQRMATGGYEQENGVYFARLWDVGTGKERRRIPAGIFPGPGNGRKRALAFSPDGTMLAGGGWGNDRLRLWDAATGKELTVFPKVGRDIEGIAFAPDGKTVAAAGDNVYLYDPVTGKERLRIERRAQRLAFSRDGSVLTGAVSGAIDRWDAASGRPLTPAAAQDSAVEQVLVSADGRQLFTTDQDGDLLAWDTAGGKPPRRLAGGVDRGVVASPDRRFLAWTARADYGNSRIRLYDVAAGRVLDPVLRSREGFPVIGGAAAVTGFLPDGKSLLTLEGWPPTFRLWDLESGTERRSFAVTPPKPAAELPGAPPAKDRGVPVRLWSVATGQAGPELNEPLTALGVPDEPGPAVDDLGQPRAPLPFYRLAALSPDGKMLAVGRDWAGIVNRRMRSMDGRAFSPDGRFLADWAENPFGRSRMDHIDVWDAATGRAVTALVAGPRPGAANAAFAPDGRTFAAAAADGTVRLWEVATWKVRAEFRGHRDRVTALAFGPDGRLFTGGLDTVVLGWDVRPPRAPAQGTLADAWKRLAETDAQVGFQAEGRFLAEPGKAVEWFAARVAPAVRPDPARVTALIADLGADDFATRERATAELKEYGPGAAAALRAAAARSSSPEARRRAEGILREMASTVPPPRDLRALRAAEVLEWIATGEARALLHELAKGDPEARLTRDAAAACKRLDGRK